MRSKEDPFYSPMPVTMASVMVVMLCACFLFTGLYLWLGQDWMEACAITCGTIAYHFIIRFLSPVILTAVNHKHYHPDSFWFRQKSWENALYEKLRVKHWKAHIPAYDPSQFSLKVHTPEEIVNNMCHAEAVHELIVVLGYTSLFFAVPFGAFPVFLITAVIAGLCDTVFMVLQRYNRPRVQRLMDKTGGGVC